MQHETYNRWLVVLVICYLVSWLTGLYFDVRPEHLVATYFFYSLGVIFGILMVIHTRRNKPDRKNK